MKNNFFSLTIVMSLALSACMPTVTPTLTPPTGTAVPPTPTPESQGRTLLVTSTADSGPGTLRQAMQDAQNGDTITFDPAIFPSDAPVTISITGDLPGITQGNLTIDASNVGVILDGSNASGDWLAGLQIVSSNANTIRGLQISNFTGPGIAISGDAQYNIIGGDPSIGSGPFGQGNLFSHNDFGVVLSTPGTSLNTITGNLIGTDAEGAQALGNRLGVGITESANRNAIGPYNIIAYNDEFGIQVESSESLGNTITQNSIHDNGMPGIYLVEGGNNQLVAPVIFNFDLTDGLVTGFSCANCTVEIFSDSGDEGSIYEGRAEAEDNGAFTFVKGTPLAGPSLTSTVTDPDGNTSVFSPPTQGSSRNLSLQVGNALPMLRLQTKPSNELADNRIGLSYAGGGLWLGIRNNSLGSVLDQVTNLGAKWVHTQLYEIEPPIEWSVSEYDIPPEFDQFLDDLAANGVAVNYILHFWDKAGHANGEVLPNPRFQDDEDVQEFLDYVRFIVRHFKGRILYYTIWSEPDACGPDSVKCILPEDYIALARQVSPVIREEDPEAKVVSAPNVLFFDRDDLFTLLRSDVVKQFDVISWHPLYDVFPNHPFFGDYYYEYPVIIREIQQTASAHGFEGEYWGTEMTWCSQELLVCQPYGQGRGWAIVETDLLAAKYYARGIVMQLGMDVGVGLGEFHQDAPWSYPTMRNLSTVMAGNKPLEIPVEIESDAAPIASYGFSLPNGDRLFAVWNDGIAVDDDPGIPATLTFPGTSAQKVIGIDVLHGFEQELIIVNENGNLIIRNFLVKDYPIILRLMD